MSHDKHARAHAGPFRSAARAKASSTPDLRVLRATRRARVTLATRRADAALRLAVVHAARSAVSFRHPWRDSCDRVDLPLSTRKVDAWKPHCESSKQTELRMVPSETHFAYARPAGTADAVLRRHLPLVRDVAHQVACRKPPHVEVDELMSWGMEGLLDAYRRFRPDKHASFRTYARFRVRGVIMDNLRERDLLSRTARRKAVLLDRTRARLEATLGRTPRRARNRGRARRSTSPSSAP